MMENLGYSLRSNFQLRSGLILAPMSGVTCLPFRRLIKELNGEALAMTVTEFISVEAMTRNVKRSLEMMRRHSSESLFSIQIFGFDTDRMVLAGKMVEDAGADCLDINCGCPAPKVVRKGGGCDLMRNPAHLAALLKKVRAEVKIPLTLKMRAGWDQSSVNATEIARIAESEGVEAIAVHGRTRVQMYRGEADWNLISAVADTVSIPVIGSGDIVDYESARVRVTDRAVKALMVGRGALSNPFVFKEILSASPSGWRSDTAVITAVLKRYTELLREELPDRIVIGRIKQLASGMCRQMRWRKALLRTQNMTEVERLLQDPDDYLRSLPESAKIAIITAKDHDLAVSEDMADDQQNLAN